MKYLILASLLFSTTALAGANDCAQIKDGSIMDKAGNTVQNGFDQWGYNYKAHMFNGLYDNNSRPAEPVSEGMIQLQMKWSDDWLSDQDCDWTGKLDRGGEGNDGGSKGWLTNHEQGSYIDDNGEEQFYTYFAKIVYMPDNAAACPEADRIWGTYCITQEVWNDPAAGMHGKVHRERIVGPGLGQFK